MFFLEGVVCRRKLVISMQAGRRRYPHGVDSQELEAEELLCHCDDLMGTLKARLWRADIGTGLRALHPRTLETWSKRPPCKEYHPQSYWAP